MTDQEIRETTTPKGAKGSLGEQQAPLDMFFQSTPVPMLLLDTDGLVRQINRAAEETMASLAGGTTGHDLGIAFCCVHSGKHLGSCGDSPACQTCSLHGLVIRTLQTAQPHHQVEVKIVSRHSPEQRDCYLLVSTAIIQWPQGRRILVCLEDISAQRQAELDMRKALQEVERLKEKLQRENVSLREQVKAVYDSEEVVGNSEELKVTLQKAEYAAATDASVLITGETGTGKELIAHIIHNGSARKERPLVTVNCAALSSNLIESELFGHIAGAFTGALADRVGRFELAHGGTIFLDEIGEIPPELQVKLLRVLQQGQFERVGSSDTRMVDVRVVAATNRNLQAEMAKGTFRSDLYYRLAVFPIEVPPLRVRRKDIPLLVWYFITKTQKQLGKRIKSIPKAIMDRLTQYDWPGNVRELQNVIERAVILSPGPELQVSETLARAAKRHKIVVPYQDIESVEQAHITQVLEDCRWKINGEGNAADVLGLKPSTLRSRMKKLGIERP